MLTRTRAYSNFATDGRFAARERRASDHAKHLDGGRPVTGRNLAKRRITAPPAPPPPVAAVVSPLPPFAALLVRLVAAGRGDQ